MDQTTAAQAPSQTRSASGSNVRTHGSARSSNPDKQISQIEKSVTHLLVATKQLLETLTQWSRGNSQEEEVSDVYVRLGYEFNLACRAFNSIGVDTADLGPVPDLLRTILEDTLSQPASPQALDNYLPRIRDIIINLLQGLKRKQSKLRTRPIKDGTGKPDQTPSRQMSTTSTLVNDTMEGSSNDLPSITRTDTGRGSPAGVELYDPAPDALSGPSMNMERSSLRRSIRREPQKKIPSSDSSSTMSSTTAQNIPIISPPVPPDDNPDIANFPYAPPPAPKQDALIALQRGGDLERRASRRFSAYQIQKHLGASPNGVPVIPAAQNSPVPNRGREARESMRAVTSRTSYQPTKQKSGGKLHESSPTRSGTFRTPQTISEENEEPLRLDTRNTPHIEPPLERQQSDSPTAKTPEEYRAPLPQQDVINSPPPELGPTISGPLSPAKDNVEYQQFESAQSQLQPGISKSPVRSDSPVKRVQAPPIVDSRTSTTPPPTAALDLDSSPASAKELTLFLQYKSKVKKFMLSGGYEELSIPRLQLAFIEKFAWNTHNNGVDLPEIYIQDPISGVRHELEDLSDVKDRSVLVLNFEVLDEVKKHFDEGIGGLKDTLEGVRSLIDGQSTLMQRFGDRQLEASKEMARLSTAPTPRIARPPMDFDTAAAAASTSGPASETALLEVQNLRREIAVLRQTYSSMSADFAASMKDIKAKADNVKTAAANAVQPIYEGSAGRTHLNEGKKTLQSDSEALVNRVDNLSDTVEDLRKDVVSRGVRPRPRDLEVLSKEIAATTKALAQMKEFMKKEKPVWTKIWEQELNLVCTERDDLTQQEELMADLHGDLEDVQNVFNLVEEAMKQQNIQGGVGSLRQVSKTIEVDPALDPTMAKEGVLGEVRALRPNHEDRLEAIERAEKARQKDLESRKANEFQREVEQFVEEGKLKKTGGADEVERLREMKDKRAIQENWATQQAQEVEKARKRAEREAAKAAAKAAAEAEAAGEPTGQPNAEIRTADGAHDTSLEGEASFQDAPTGDTPRATSPQETEAANGITTHGKGEESLRGYTNEAKDHDHINESVTGLGLGPGAGNKEWWKPAVF